MSGRVVTSVDGIGNQVSDSEFFSVSLVQPPESCNSFVGLVVVT